MKLFSMIAIGCFTMVISMTHGVFAEETDRSISDIGAQRNGTSYKKRTQQNYYIPPIVSKRSNALSRGLYPSYDPTADNPGPYIIIIEPADQQVPTQPPPADGFDRPLFSDEPYNPYE